MKSLKKKKKVNHVAFLLDASGSMMRLQNSTREVLAKLMDGLSVQEKKFGIETRVHVYTFGYNLVSHMENRTARQASSFTYSARNEGTALIDSTTNLVGKLKDYETTDDDVSFLVYVLTDGQETENRTGATGLRRLLNGLNDDWTMAIMVPDYNCKRQAESYGFPDGNIQIWETTERGMEDLRDTLIGSTVSYYTARDAGIKSTKCLFSDFKNPTKTEVKKKLEEVDPGTYETLIVRDGNDGWAIKDFVESWTKKPYRVGSAYYQVSKPETIQAKKSVAVIEKDTGKMYSGDKARSLIGLPGYDVKAEPADFSKFDLFVQSTSTNRKLVKDTHLIVFK